MENVDRPVQKILLTDINAKAYNVRGSISPQDCVDLAKRIRIEGLLHPVTLEKTPPEELEANDGKPYRLIAGFRRFMAHRINSAEDINAVIFDKITPLEAAIINFTENTSRADLSIMQEARGVDRIRRLRSGTLRELAEVIGKSSKWVQQRLWAMELEPAIQKDIEDGWIKTNHIDQLHLLKTPEQRYAYVKQIKSIAITGEKPRKSMKQKQPFKKKNRDRIEIFEMQDHIIDKLGSGRVGNLPFAAQMMVQMLGWVAGEATDMEVYGNLRKIASDNGLHYEVPESALQALQG